MRRTTAVLLVLLGLTVAVAMTYPKWGPRFVRGVTEQTSALLGDEDVQRETPQQFLVRLRQRYALPPDRRFVDAFGEIAALADRRDHVAVGRADDGTWELRLGADSLQLPELPTFAQALTVLRAFAASTVMPSAPSGQAVGMLRWSESFHPAELFSRLAEANRRWQQGERSAVVIRLAAQAATRLAVVSVDSTDTAPLVLGRALGLLACIQALEPGTLVLEESMLAERLGYSGHAKAKAAELAPEDPWRLYLERRYTALADVAKRSDRHSYLWLSLLAEGEYFDPWLESLQTFGYVDDALAFHAVATGFRLRRLGFTSQLGIRTSQMASAAMLVDVAPFLPPAAAVDSPAGGESGGESGVESSRHDSALAIERAVAAHAASLPGPFLDAALYRAFHHGFIRSGLFEALDETLSRRGDERRALTWATALAGSENEIQEEMGRWYKHLVEAKAGKEQRKALLADLKAGQLGVPMLERTLSALLAHYEKDSPEITRAVDMLAARLDSRIDHRHLLAGHARDELMHLSLADRLYRSIDADDPASTVGTWLAHYAGDVDALLARASDRSRSVAQRAYALELAAQDGVDGLGPLFEELIGVEPVNWDLRKEFIAYLQEKKAFDAAGREAGAWLQLKDDDADPFAYWQATLAVARMHRAAGEYDRAWATVEPIIDGHYAVAMADAADLAWLRGDRTTALHVAKQLHEIYPSALTASLPLVRLYWLDGKYADAAHLLKGVPKLNADRWRYTIGPVFNDSVRDGADAMAIFHALAAAEVSAWDLRQLTVPLVKVDPGLAFKLRSSLTTQPRWQPLLDLYTYAALAHAEGEATATRWLQERTREVPKDLLASMAIDQGVYGPLWTVVDPDGTAYPDAVWLYRAVAFVLRKQASEDNRRALHAYYATAGDGHYDSLGKLLMGMTDEPSITSRPMSVRQVSESAYYLGLRAATDGRHADAADWLRVSIDTGDSANGEYRWSLDQLTRWRAKGRDLGLLTSRGELP